ncbi:MAG: SRPBCC domain-containing protein [Chloroflexota bacterium]|nr:SRPBCC domain-containing protein [Chloroflexota bacterium]
MWQIEHTLTIAAPPATVWAVLTDLDSYPAWNRYSPSASGDLVVGGTVTITAHIGKTTQRVANRVLTLRPDAELCWRSMSGYSWLVRGTRCRTLTPLLDEGTRFFQQEVFTGVIAGMVQRQLGNAILDGMRLDCICIQREAERRHTIFSESLKR